MPVCKQCRQECEVIAVDMGIGPYEFWGMKGRDVQIVAVSACCEDIAYEGINEDGELYGEITDIDESEEGPEDDDRWERELEEERREEIAREVDEGMKQALKDYGIEE